MTECLLYINKCEKYVECSMYVLIKEVHVVIRTELKTLGTLSFTFCIKKKGFKSRFISWTVSHVFSFLIVNLDKLQRLSGKHSLL